MNANNTTVEDTAEEYDISEISYFKPGSAPLFEYGEDGVTSQYAYLTVDISNQKVDWHLSDTDPDFIHPKWPLILLPVSEKVDGGDLVGYLSSDEFRVSVNALERHSGESYDPNRGCMIVDYDSPKAREAYDEIVSRLSSLSEVNALDLPDPSDDDDDDDE